MRTLIQILTLLFLLQNIGVSAWADTHLSKDMPHHDTDMHSMDMGCCDMDLAGLVDCALECLSNCPMMNVADSADNYLGRDLSGHFLLPTLAAFTSFDPPPETPPPSV